MFSKLFAESGLSLDRLKALLSVAAAGSIVKATGGDPVKQSQYSRQIKELEDFFRIKLVERHGKGIRLTANGKELARISRFFLLGLSNFQRGCLTEEQTFRIGASATFIQHYLLPIVSGAEIVQGDTRYIVEVVGGDEIERRLHDLTLDFGVTTHAEISRPLQLNELGKWRLNLWVPSALHKAEKSAALAFKERRLPLAIAVRELDACGADVFAEHDCRLVCDNFLQALEALKKQQLATVLPDYLNPPVNAKAFFRVRMAGIDSRAISSRLAWNPRLLRLNPHAARTKDFLRKALAEQMTARST
ncbi:MAG TPA: LysR family transcriptional regulator [Candidatus Paceibacterota bacterium]|nr:LysR family transcriptional regulator [Candidatus Paceibacterota bacterium]